MWFTLTLISHTTKNSEEWWGHLLEPRNSIGVKNKKEAVMTVLKDFFSFGMSKQLANNTVHRLMTDTCDSAVWLPIYSCLNNSMHPIHIGHDLH